MSKEWALLERFEVPDYDDPSRNYLTRWRLIATPWFSVFLHRMDGPDPRQVLHNHPWPFISFVLRGGYDEQRRDGVLSKYYAYFRPVHRVNVMPLAAFHYIDALHRTPTWTLMFTGRRSRTWGYLDRGYHFTRYDKHPFNDEFEAALAWRRNQGADR